MSEFICPGCGCIFDAPFHSGKTYCSTECRIASAGKNRPKKDTELYLENYHRAMASNNRLAAVTAEARNSGLSYGKYMALKKEGKA